MFEGVSVEGSPVEVADIFKLHLLYPLVHDCSLCSSETLRQTRSNMHTYCGYMSSCRMTSSGCCCHGCYSGKQ